jgi:hypothetical protein
VIVGMSGETCVVLVDVGDALAVGLSMKVIARGQPMPAETRDVYNRVGEQLVSAARCAETTERQGARSAGVSVSTSDKVRLPQIDAVVSAAALVTNSDARRGARRS